MSGRALRLIAPVVALGLGFQMTARSVQAQDEQVEPRMQTIPVNVDEPAAVTGSEATQLDTIQVTADKRLKAQRDIPGSVGALRGEDLEKMRAQGMKDYLKLIPGVTYLDQGNEESIPIIRGIATSISFGITPITTGIFLDDMPFGDLFISLGTPDMNPFDLERVEVLKGPQGTLFGAQALAGAVRYIVQKPNHGVWETKFSETVAETENGGGISRVTAGAINIPLFGDAVALRAVGLERKDPGLYDMGAHDSSGNTLREDPDADRMRQTSGRILASWNPLDDLKLSAFYFGQKTHQDDWGQADNARKPQSDKFPFRSPRDHDFGGGNLLATWDLGWGRLLSSTNRMTKYNYFVLPLDAQFGLSNQNQNEAVEILGDKIRGYSQEFRLMSPEGGDRGNWEWLAGGSYMRHENAAWEYANIGPAMPYPTSPDQFTDAQKKQSAIFATWDQVAIEKGLFGEVTRRLGEYWEATVGARQYRTGQVTDAVACGFLVAAEFNSGNPDCIVSHDDQNSSGINPKFSIRYLHNRNMQLYALAARGFQFGGVQIAPASPVAISAAQGAGFTFAPYKSSKLWNYESGIRTEWLDRRLRFDLAFFYLDWRDLQVSVQVNVPGTMAPFYAFVANVGRAHSKGVESALEVIPFTGARWISSAAWITAVTDELFDTENADGGVKPGARLPGTPRFQWSNVLSYEHRLPYFSSWTIGPVLTHSHIGGAPDAIRPTGTIGGYDTLDARLALSKPDSRFLPELSLGVNNLTDVRGATYHLFIPAATPSGTPVDLYHFIPPRTAVLSLSIKY